jgi:uncharacterized surface protein with fasciclin (FAS1) repeats
MKNIVLAVAGALASGAFTWTMPALSQLSASSDKQYVIASAKTEEFKEKEGFQRKEKDIINTLKDNDIAGFSILLDGLQQATDLGDTLKNNGPYTFFAISDKAFKKMPSDDRQSLWANKTKLKQVLKYDIVFGQINAATLRNRSKLKSLEGHSISLSTRGNAIYADKSLITMTDIPCSNGVIHVLDEVIMPPLMK